MSKLAEVSFLLSFFWLFLLPFGLIAQTETPASSSPELGIGNPKGPSIPGSILSGSWQVERGIYELFGNLKEVGGGSDQFFSSVIFESGGKGTFRLGTKGEDQVMEYDLKDGQNLTIAYGSRLKPTVDLYRVLLLGDGSLFVRSTRLSLVNGTITYILKKL